jgi:acyl homoserine lactone synthase
MMQVITPEFYGAFAEELSEMHRLRCRVFKGRLDWDVQTSGDMEVDEFDALHPVYLIQRANDSRIQGCVRLLPSAGPIMLRDAFPVLLDGQAFQPRQSIWESSRFALDLDFDASSVVKGLSGATYELFAGMIEFGLSRRLTEIITVTDARMERILRRAGWPLRRMGRARTLGNTLAVAGYLEISMDCLMRVRGAGKLRSPVLWEPSLKASYDGSAEAEFSKH